MPGPAGDGSALASSGLPHIEPENEIPVSDFRNSDDLVGQDLPLANTPPNQVMFRNWKAENLAGDVKIYCIERDDKMKNLLGNPPPNTMDLD